MNKGEGLVSGRTLGGVGSGPAAGLRVPGPGSRVPGSRRGFRFTVLIDRRLAGYGVRPDTSPSPLFPPSHPDTQQEDVRSEWLWFRRVWEGPGSMWAGLVYWSGRDPGWSGVLVWEGPGG